MAYTSKYTGSEIEGKLDEIFSSHLQDKEIETVENGVAEVTADSGFIGLSKVKVTTAIPTEEKVVDITENGTTEVVAANGFLSKVSVNVNVASGGGGTTIVSPKDVNFRDYDGTVLYAYTKDEFLALNELPPLPTQPGLICQEWNWDYADAIEHVNLYGILEAGATYITDDGKTRLYISLPKNEYNVTLYICQTISNGVVIDWGDNSPLETIEGTGSVNKKHTYPDEGNYVISLSVAEGCVLTLGSKSNGLLLFYGSDTSRERYLYLYFLKKIEFGNRVDIGSYTACKAQGLQSVTIPNSATGAYQGAFSKTLSLRYLALPKSCTELGTNAFGYSNIVNISCPSVQYIGDYAFESCYALEKIILPNKRRTISDSAFSNCYGITLAVFPGTVTLNNYAFSGCYSLRYVHMPNTISSISRPFIFSSAQIKCYDFRDYDIVPSLSYTNVFGNEPYNIVVPDALYDEWIAATNWSSYASKIVKASEFNG
jgi:hypothetical protein